jgi:hypothetical protein
MKHVHLVEQVSRKGARSGKCVQGLQQLSRYIHTALPNTQRFSKHFEYSANHCAYAYGAINDTGFVPKYLAGW